MGHNMKQNKFKIMVNNWDKHNASIKKGHTHFLLSKRLFNDEKIAQLKPIEFQLWLYLLTISADMMSNQFIISAQLVPRYMRISANSFQNILTRLQCFQLVSFKKIESPYIIEKNIIEKNRIEKKRRGEKNQIVRPEAEPTENLISFYCELWKARYGTSPPIRPQDAKNLKAFTKTHGSDASKKLLENYFAIPDSWFIKKRHDIVTFLNSLNVIAAFIESGNVITSKELNELDKAVAMKQTFDALDRGEI